MSIPKLMARLAAGFFSVALAALITAPAGAFFMEVPQSVKDGFTKLKLLAQEGQMTPQPPQPGMLGQFQPNQNQTGPAMGNGGFQQNPGQMGPNQMGPNQGINIDQGIRNQPMDGQNQGQNQKQGQMGPNNQGQNQGQTGPDGQGNMGPNKQDQQRQLQDMKRNLKPMENNLKQFEKMMQANEKNGQKLSPEDQQKLQEVKSKLETIKNSASAEDLQDFDMGQLNNDMQELDQSRREAEESGRRVQDVQRNMKGAEQGLNMFEKQVNALAKKKITIPQELKDNLQKIKTIIATVKKAKTWEEMEAVGVEDLQDLMMGLDDYRQQLEMLSRWPQTLKQLDQQLKNLDSQYKKSQAIVTKLAKKGIDLSVQITAFKEAIDKLKSVRAEAVAKIASGTSDDIQAALELLESDFFGQMDDVMQHQNIIQTMSNLGQFPNEFKRTIAQAQAQIKTLARKKIDTSELAVILNDMNIKGKEILAMIKAPTSDLDEDTVMSDLQEMGDLRQQFADIVAELTGADSAIMPWEQGKPQIQSPTQSFSGFMNSMPKQPPQPQPQETTQEMPAL